MLGQLVEFAVGAGLEATRLGMLKNQCVGPAAEIAQAQGWVSTGRLRTRMGLSLRDARVVLSVACQRGLLYEAVNGRFYVPAKTAPSLGDALSSTIFAPLQDEWVGTRIDRAPEPARRSGLAVVCGGIAVAIVGLGAWSATTLGRREAIVTVYRPSAPTGTPPAMIQPMAAMVPTTVAAPTPTLATVESEATSISTKLNAAGGPVQSHARRTTKHAHHHRGSAPSARAGR